MLACSRERRRQLATVACEENFHESGAFTTYEFYEIAAYDGLGTSGTDGDDVDWATSDSEASYQRKAILVWIV